MNIRQDCAYAGIGSRATPQNILYQMTDLAQHLGQCSWILRSGGAKGADKAFEKGATKKEIFLATDEIPDAAFEIAATHHPTWGGLGPYVKKLHARNAQQILGKNLDNKVKFVVCWTIDGAETETSVRTGGTGQAIRIANAYNIPVYNLFNEGRFEVVKDVCDCALM
jgi:hypothetical protein